MESKNARRWARDVRAGVSGLLAFVTCTVTTALAQGVIGTFPSVAFPAGNPSSTAKIMLGKALFFDEQLSSDDTMACATCHMPEAGGADPRAGARAPGGDLQLGTADDLFGSPGMIRQDANRDYALDTPFGAARQVTPRNAPTVVNAAFFRSLFWDLRARETFRDRDGGVVLASRAALESQAVGPPISDIEMGHAGIDWEAVEKKLQRVEPLRLASDLPESLAGYLAKSSGRGYGPLFEEAFDTPAITRERVAMAIATYERTLVSDQTPFDLGTMTPQQARGLEVFRDRGICRLCHPLQNGLFSDGEPHTIGLPGHARVVKAPTLRNVGLRRRLMHSGQIRNLDEAVTHYENVGFFRPLTAAQRLDVLAFLGNALTDPRVLAAEPPFDRPRLRSEVVPHDANVYGAGSPGTGGFVPRIIANVPPHVGNPTFKLGVAGGLGGAPAFIAVSPLPATPVSALIPVHIDLGTVVSAIVELRGSGAGQGVATFRLPIADDPSLRGVTAFAQWFVVDPNAILGVAATPGARFDLF